MLELLLVLILEYNQIFFKYGSDTLFSSKQCSQICIFFDVLLIRNSFYNYPKYYSFLIVFATILQTYLIKIFFYDPDFDYNDLFPQIVPMVLLNLVFMFSKDKHHDELLASKFNVTFLNTLFKISFGYFNFYEFKRLYLERALSFTSLADFDLNLHFKSVIIDTISHLNVRIPIFLTLYFLSNRDSKHILTELKYIMLFSAVITFCFVVYSPVIGNYIYEKMSSNISSPYNVIFYNMLPDQDTRYRMLIYSCIWIFRI